MNDLAKPAPSTNAFTLTVEDGVGKLVFDLPGEKVNTFGTGPMVELSAMLDKLAARRDLKALVVLSAKNDIFVAGADIKEIAALSGAAEALERGGDRAAFDRAKAEAREKSVIGQRVFQRVAELPFPTIAVIDGACLGGGLEFALACTYRVASDAEKVSIGLPEVMLGILPGWGGTQRLPRLVGLPTGLELILSGKPLNGPKAFKAGLVDACVARAFLPDEVPRFVGQILSPEGKAKILARRRAVHSGFSKWLLAGNPAGRWLVVSKTRKMTLGKTRGLIPAPVAALDVIARTYGGDLQAGLNAEADAFADLVVTSECRCQVDCFLGGEALKKLHRAPKDLKPVRRGGVLGAGIMGGGIAWAFAASGIPARVKDVSWDAVAKAYKTADDYNRQLVKIRKLTPNEASLRLHRIGSGLDYAGFRGCDAVVEAVVEDMNVKKKVLAEVEGHVRDDCLLVSNTSSLSVGEMASALRRPERFLGMHFFNPVNRMPLVEVIQGAKTSPEAVTAVVALGRKLGKTVIVAKDCPGFLVNRILLPYLNEAAWMLQEGGTVEAIDAAIYRYGMPMGPFTLADEIGIDTGVKVAKVLGEGYGARMKVADVLARVHEELQLKGAKGGKGFYLHEKKAKKKPLNPEIPDFLDGVRRELGVTPRAIDAREIVDRCILIMVNEAALCIAEKVVENPTVLDLAMVYGTGFPPQRGGPLHYADRLGVERVVERLIELKARCGDRFTPAPLLLELAAKKSCFFPAGAG